MANVGHTPFKRHESTPTALARSVFNPADLQASLRMDSIVFNLKIILYKVLLALYIPPRDRHLTRLAYTLLERFLEHEDTNDINKAIELYRQALALRHPPHPHFARALNNLGFAILVRFTVPAGFAQQGDIRDINEAIDLHREALGLHTPSHLDRGVSLHKLGFALLTRFEEQEDMRDIDEAIDLYREALSLHSPPHPDRGSSLNDLATAILSRYKQQGDERDINEAIELNREALALCEALDPDREDFLNSLANAVRTRFEHQGDTRDIGEAIELLQEALAICPATHPGRGSLLSDLANTFLTRFQKQGDIKDINEAIDLYKKALTLCEKHDPDRGTSLGNMAIAISKRFEQLGNMKDIDDAIDLQREALTLHDPPHPDRAQSLHNLAVSVLTRFGQQGVARDLNEAIELHREALALRESPHADRRHSLGNLATAVWMRFQQQGDTKAIDESIELHREALQLCEPHYPHRGRFLNNLAHAVLTRFQEQGNGTDLNEAIDLHREALTLHKLPHPDRGKYLNNLANAILRRLQWQGDSEDITEAIELHREALSLREPPHPERGSSLGNLATAIRARFLRDGNLNDCDEAIGLYREAFTLCGPDHPDYYGLLNNVAIALRERFEQQKNTKDLHEAIQLTREALTHCESPHVDRGFLLDSLAKCFTRMYECTHDTHALESACDLFYEAATYLSSSPFTRFHQACFWANLIAQHSPTSSLTAYQTAIKLLPQVAGLHLDLTSRQHMVSTITERMVYESDGLPSDAATCAVGLGQYHTAVELLEASRSIFWSQALHLRTPAENLATVHPDLSTKLTDLARQLEHASFRDTAEESVKTQQITRSIESEGLRCRQLNEDWEQTIKEVQSLPGFEHFMQPKDIFTLRQAAESGPIIILITTSTTSFALILTLSSEVQYVNLPEYILPEAHLFADLARGLSTPAFDFDTFVESREEGNERSELQSRLFAGREGTVKMDSDEVFQELLADLWKNIVKPVFEALNLKARTAFSHFTKSVNPPRLWWCPTGPFTFLPIHAAGIYRKDMKACVSDYIISSYTPTLAALLDPPTRTYTATQFKMTAVIEPKAPNFSPLPGARAELAKLAASVPPQWLTILANTTVETAQVHLSESSIMHFACHGVQDLNRPLDSGLVLTSGRLKVYDIMHRREGEHSVDIKKSMSLAFLSACETARGDKTVPDEAMHLAASLLFAGFRGVVATMWTMNDLDGPKIADIFYEYLFKDCDPNSDPPVLPDLTQAAKALHLAVLRLREEPNVSFKRWVPFVHYGL
ncbi:CHAT domain-containing protein [Mycena pura]|uniref:CHAT domain-containing protein n=1 Tax=Mycena pura TaxID=153505 RepID=A0AAD6VKV1_9AGAR|nr:CHAT domain-containing protein [Mycena pura]